MADKQQRRVTIRDIASEVGVTPSTVSKTLNGQWRERLVGSETRQRIWETARRLGYELDRLRSRPGRLQRVCVCCPPQPPYIDALARISDLLDRQGLHPLVYTVSSHLKSLDVARGVLKRGDADGVIFVGSRDDPAQTDVGDLPCVFIGEVPEKGQRVWQVVSDNEAGGITVGEHLWSLGHRRIAAVICEPTSFGQKRLAGLRSVCEARGQAQPDQWVLSIESHDNPEIEAETRDRLPGFLSELQRCGQSPTAMFCNDDSVAMIVLSVLWRHGWRVPEDISLVGFTDAPYARLATPPLTTVRESYGDLGTIAIQLLMLRCHAGTSAVPETRCLPGRLIVRESTALVGETMKVADAP